MLDRALNRNRTEGSRESWISPPLSTVFKRLSLAALLSPERFQETLRPQIPIPHLRELFEVPSKSRQTVQAPGLVAAPAPLLHGRIVVTEVEWPELRLPAL